MLRSGAVSVKVTVPASLAAWPVRVAVSPRVTVWPTVAVLGVASVVSVGVVSVMAEKDVDGILAALEPVFDQVVVTNNGSPRALDIESLALRAEERFGPERVVAASTLPDAIETATALVEESGHDGEGLSGSGMVITGSVVTAGAARTLFGRDPE